MLLSRAARSLRRLPALNSMSCCQPSCRTGSAGHSARHAASTSHAACEAADPAPAGATTTPAASQPAAPSSRPASAAQQQAAAPSPPGFARTFYKRPLNPPAIAFSSQGGRRLFAEALAGGTAEAFFPLVEQFRTQDEPAFCGLASLAMVLNALSIDPRRAWKGPWRYYSEALLDCCRDLERVKEEGIVLAQAACLARCNGAGVSLVQPPPVEEGEGGGGGEGAPAVDAARAAFRAAVEASCAGRPGAGFLIASYSRAAVGQTGDGHFSPIAAFHAGGGGAAAGGGAGGGGGGGPEEEGGPGPEPARVLVLDTARFKYPPHWLPLDSLFAAMRPPDAVTGEPRGWLGLVPAAVRASVLFSLASPGGGGEGEAGAGGGGGEAGGGEGEAGPTAADLAAARAFAASLPSAPPATLEAALAALPLGAVARLVQVRAAGGDEGAPQGAPVPTPTSEDAHLGPAAPAPSCHIPAAADALLAEMRGTGGLVEGLAGALDAAHPPGRCAGRAAAEGRGGLLPERVALFLAALPSGVWAGAGPGVAASVTPHPGSLAEVEAAYLARQWAELPELERLGAACAAACACGVGVGEAA